MNGYLVTFFTQQDRRHHGKPLAEWLLRLPDELGLHGATLIPAAEGIGHHLRRHSSHFFELTDQPVLVQMAVTNEENVRLFARLEAEHVRLFYVRSPVEFGMLGEAAV
jgi:uncharacterized protein